MKGILKIILLLAIVPVLLGGGYVGLSLLAPDMVPGLSASASPAEEPTQERVEREPRVTLSTKDRVVTLADTPQLRYLKIEIVLEFPTPENDKLADPYEYKKLQDDLFKELTPLMPAIEDGITTVLAGRTAIQVTSPEGKEELKGDLMERLNRLPLGRPVTNVYFTQFIIQ